MFVLVQCSECQSNGNLKQAWVNGARGHDSLKLASALNFQSDGNSNTRCSCRAVAQRRFGGGLCPALRVPRVRLLAGNEQRGLARNTEVRHSCARSHRLRAVASAARPRPCDICQHTSSQPLFTRLFVTPRNKNNMGDGVPTDQLSHNHCDCTDSHCNSHIVLPFVPSPVTSPSAAEAAHRLRRDEEVLDAPEGLRQPVVGVGGAQEEQGQERLAL